MEREKHGRPDRDDRHDRDRDPRDYYHVFHKLEEIESKIDTNQEQIMARMDDIEREVGETEAAISALAAIIPQLVTANATAVADRDAAQALAASLQTQVDAGNTELAGDLDKATSLAARLDAKQQEIAAILATASPTPPVV